MKRVLITGATGFVGTCLARILLERGHDLHLLVRPGYKNWRIKDISNDVRLHSCSLDDQADLENTVRGIRPEWVFHLATYGAYASQVNFNEMLRTNLAGLVNLTTACLKTGFEVFINTGSSSEYGLKDHAALEDETLEPNSGYAITKASATMYCRYIARSQDVNIKTLRLYSVYGPYEEPARLIPRLINYGMQGKYPPLVDPGIGRDFVYVEDVCRAFELSALTDYRERGTIYNVGTGRQSTIREAVQVVRDILDIKAAPQWESMPGRSWDTKIWVADPRKIMGELKWQPRFSLEQGIGKMIDWFRQNPAMQSHYNKTSGVLPQ